MMIVKLQVDSGPPFWEKFSDQALVHFDKPFQGWLTVEDEGKETWFNGAFVISVGPEPQRKIVPLDKPPVPGAVNWT